MFERRNTNMLFHSNYVIRSNFSSLSSRRATRSTEDTRCRTLVHKSMRDTRFFFARFANQKQNFLLALASSWHSGAATHFNNLAVTFVHIKSLLWTESATRACSIPHQNYILAFGTRGRFHAYGNITLTSMIFTKALLQRQVLVRMENKEGYTNSNFELCVQDQHNHQQAQLVLPPNTNATQKIRQKIRKKSANFSFHKETLTTARNRQS
jgi:LytS/YehU family sensor histidine kinase